MNENNNIQENTSTTNESNNVLFEVTSKRLNALDCLDDILNTNHLANGYSTSYGGYECWNGDDDDDYSDDLRDYWRFFGITLSDEEWEEYCKRCEELEKEHANIAYSQILCDITSKRKNKGNNNKPSSSNNGGWLKSQKFINGMEVDDDEFEEYNKNKKGGTRRGGKKHNKKNKNTRYEHEDWNDAYFADQATYANEIKKIVFYKTLGNTADVYEWDSLHAFNEWCEENDIQVNKSAYTTLLYYEEVHCCLDPDFKHMKSLITERSYGDLVYEITGGDEQLIREYSYSNNGHSLTTPLH